MNLTPNFEIITRPATHYIFLQRRGPFSEVAPPTWEEFFPLLNRQVDDSSIVEHLGLSGMDHKAKGEDAMMYEAGVTLREAPTKPLQGLQYRKIESGKYARFVLTGPYVHIWAAFDQIFKTLADKKIQLRPEFCIENYLNDPKQTPEDQLLTELLVPAA